MEQNVDKRKQSAFSKRIIQLSGWILWLFSLLMLLALLSYNPSDPSFNTSSNQPPTNLLGYVGSYLSDMLIQWVGIASFFPIIVFLAWGWRIIRYQHLRNFIPRTLAMFITIPVIAAIITAIPLLIFNNYIPQWPSQSGPGGSIGFVLARTSLIAAQDTLGVMGKVLIWVLTAILCVLLIPLTLGLSKKEWKRILGFFQTLSRFVFYGIARKKNVQKPESTYYTKSVPAASTRSYDRSPFRSDPEAAALNQKYVPPAYQESIRSTTQSQASELAPDNTPIFNPEDVQAPERPNRSQAVQPYATHNYATPVASAPSYSIKTGQVALQQTTLPTVPSTEPEESDPYYPDSDPHMEASYPIHTSQAEWKEETGKLPTTKKIFSLLQKPVKEHFASGSHAQETKTLSHPYSAPYAEASETVWSFPPISLLKENIYGEANKPTPEMLHANARMLETILDDYGVKGTIGNILYGPVVTLYELEPAPGIRSARVIGLSDDIARSLSVISVRIAIVPGRNIIGIEVPNNNREVVYFSELLKTENWRRHSAKLCLALGKNIFGEPIYEDLARMPHLLIAGTTGSGKSVGVNAMILSLLYRLPPEECRLILIDPKMLEFSIYEGIPHLLTPVVIEPQKALSALKWAIREMDRRYHLMSQLNVRNIDGYNQRIMDAKRHNRIITRRVQTGFDPETNKPAFEEQQIPWETFPYIVIVIDEMADLMITAGKEIEMAVQRLAQKARAAGLHVVMATQRPSVDVITGTIKANFPTRISFQVISKFDSRTILGEQGAEQLLGQGDMLFMQAGGRIQRIHGPFVSDEEVEKVVNHLRSQGEPVYVEDVTVDPAEEGGDNGRPGSGSDELYNQAISLVLQEGKASTSFIQRHLSIGYNRAAKIIEQMERERIVSPANHVGKREILVRKTDTE